MTTLTPVAIAQRHKKMCLDVNKDLWNVLADPFPAPELELAHADYTNEYRLCSNCIYATRTTGYVLHLGGKKKGRCWGCENHWVGTPCSRGGFRLDKDEA